MFYGIFGLKPKPKEGEDTFWALRDVNLEIEHGEAVALIGAAGHDGPSAAHVAEVEHFVRLYLRLVRIAHFAQPRTHDGTEPEAWLRDTTVFADAMHRLYSVAVAPEVSQCQ